MIYNAHVYQTARYSMLMQQAFSSLEQSDFEKGVERQDIILLNKTWSKLSGDCHSALAKDEPPRLEIIDESDLWG